METPLQYGQERVRIQVSHQALWTPQSGGLVMSTSLLLVGGKKKNQAFYQTFTDTPLTRMSAYFFLCGLLWCVRQGRSGISLPLGRDKSSEPSLEFI